MPKDYQPLNQELEGVQADTEQPDAGFDQWWHGLMSCDLKNISTQRLKMIVRGTWAFARAYEQKHQQGAK